MASTQEYILRLWIITSMCNIGVSGQCTDYTYTAPAIPDFFYPYGLAAGDTIFPNGEDDSDYTTPANSLSVPFVFSNERFMQYYVSANGLVSFREAVPGTAGSTILPGAQPLVAPYWSNIKLSNNDGAIYFRSTESSSVLEPLTSHIRSKFLPPLKFIARSAVIVTWENVAHANGDCNSTVSTFQVVLATDGRYSFVIFNYAGLGWNEGVDIDNTNSYSMVGLNYDDNIHYTLPGSGQSGVTQLYTSSNVGEDGVWMFQVNTEAIIYELCDQNPDALLVSPGMASPQGGTAVFISGQCVMSDTELKVKIAGEDAVVTYISDHRVKVIVPPLWRLGPVSLQLSTDNGDTFPLTVTLTLGVDPGVVPMVTRVDADSWDLNDYTVTVIWDKDALSATTVNVFFASYEENSNGDLEELLFPLLTDADNDGSAHLITDELPYFTDDDLERVASNNRLVHFGSILIKESAGSSSTDETLLYSDMHVAMYFVRMFFIELAVRNRFYHVNNTDGTPKVILPEMWQLIESMFMKHTGTTQEQLRESIKKMEIESCVMWKALLKTAVGNRCETAIHQVNLDTPVPCTLRQARIDPSWTDHTASKSHFACENLPSKPCVIQTKPTSTGAAQMACYRDDGSLSELSMAGRPLGAHPDGLVLSDGTVARRWAVDHFLYDVQPMTFCCVWGKNTDCADYKTERPDSDCENYEAPSRGGGGGDPHFLTFDNVDFTFNGVGEYVLTKVVGGLEVQARTAHRGSLKATEITSIVCKTHTSDIIEVRSAALTGLQLLTNKNVQALTGMSKVYFTGVTCHLTFDMTLLTSVEIVFRSGEEVKVTQHDGSLRFVILPLASQKGNLEGLLGDSDFNKTNDFKFPNGSVLEPSATPQEIHEYSEEWRTDASTSLFTYTAPQTFADLQDPEFIPTYFSPDMPSPDFCNMDPPCIYDYNLTESMSYAVATKEFFVQLQSIQDDINTGGECPVLAVESGIVSSPNRRYGQTVTLTCVDNYELSGSDSRTCQIDLTWSGTPTHCTKKVSKCDGFPCKNNGTCVESGSNAFCKCIDNYGGTHCEKVKTDYGLIIIVGAVVGGLLIIAILVVIILICRTRPDTHTDNTSEIIKGAFPEYDTRHGMPLFLGTSARRHSKFSFDNGGYTPYGGEKQFPQHRYTNNPRYSYDRRAYSSHPRGGDHRTVYDDRRAPPSPYPPYSANSSDQEDSIDKIYRGDYDPHPQPDYEQTVYTSHIDQGHKGSAWPGDYDRSHSGRKQPPPGMEKSNWVFKK